MRHGGTRWGRGGPENIIDFSVNLNPLGVPDFIRELIEEAVRKEVYTYYPPVDDYRNIKELVAEIYGVDPELVGVFNGSSEAISLLPACSVPEPNFSEYKRLKSYFAKELEDRFEYHLPLDEMCVVTSNPVNPTGSAIKEEEIIEYLQRGNRLFLDESFIDLSTLENNFKLAEEFKNLTVISSFTKSLSVPGLRLGFSIGYLSRDLEKRAPPWRINSISYYVFSNIDSRELKKFLSLSRSYVKSLIDSFSSPFRWYRTTTSFVLVEFPIETSILNLRLRSLGYQIREPEGFIGLRKTHGRVAINNSTPYLLRLISEVLNSEKFYK
ncbi:aminotransferase class I/II-fold pyridoxal phosphate-dependent enzyme [Stygiolobus caldivivus]|uniref:Aminotransferase n=1 Tax=Stygiolobus caldivivus TaxID=2824673 RepID=A0A8D5U7Q6_9CREN|nr:aminotransferase class I/II-fold pyridoxal phosphate-dependent enzyme [Stygiolobus caldivivus]BCU70752.1 aspartate aminotransferase [Stygiolobus caldivivus]